MCTASCIPLPDCLLHYEHYLSEQLPQCVTYPELDQKFLLSCDVCSQNQGPKLPDCCCPVPQQEQKLYNCFHNIDLEDNKPVSSQNTPVKGHTMHQQNSHIFYFNSPVLLTLMIAHQSFCMILRLTMVHHHATFGY